LLAWIKLRRLGALNYAKFNAVNSGVCGLLNLITLDIVSVVLAPILGFIGSGLQAMVYNWNANTKFVNGIDLLVEAPDDAFASKKGEAWVKVRFQGTKNYGKFSAVNGLLTGVLVGIALAVALVIAWVFLGYTDDIAGLSPGLLALAALFLVPIVFTIGGAVIGMSLAAAGNFIRGLDFVNGMDVLIRVPDNYAAAENGERQAWAKMTRFGAVNLVKINAVQDLLIGALIAAALIAIGIAVMSSEIAGILIFFLLIPVAGLIIGAGYGALTAAIANVVMGLGFVNGIDVLVAAPEPGKPAAKPAVARKAAKPAGGKR
jgi:hypothetical protein